MAEPAETTRIELEEQPVADLELDEATAAGVAGGLAPPCGPSN